MPISSNIDQDYQDELDALGGQVNQSPPITPLAAGLQGANTLLQAILRQQIHGQHRDRKAAYSADASKAIESLPEGAGPMDLVRAYAATGNPDLLADTREVLVKDIMSRKAPKFATMSGYDEQGQPFVTDSSGGIKELPVQGGASPGIKFSAEARRSEGAANREQRAAIAQQRAAEGAANREQRASLAVNRERGRSMLSGGGAKQSEFERTMSAAGIDPGSEEYKKAARIKARLEPGPGGGGFEMSYDAEGRPVVSMGGSRKPFTEGQSKALMNVSLAEGANKDMDDLAQGGFDPTSATGAAGVTAAGVPGLNMLAPKDAQRQNAANVAFVQSVNYQRSGAASTEPEYNRAVESVLAKYGDKPDTAAQKRRYRIALVEGVKAQDGRIDVIVNDILSKAGGEAPPTQPAAPAAFTKQQVMEAFKAGPDTPERREKARRAIEAIGAQ